MYTFCMLHNNVKQCQITMLYNVILFTILYNIIVYHVKLRKKYLQNLAKVVFAKLAKNDL